MIKEEPQRKKEHFSHYTTTLQNKMPATGVKKKKGSKKKKTSIKKQKDRGTLPDDIEDMRTRVTYDKLYASNTSGIDDPNAFKSLGFDNSLRMDDFKKELNIKFMSSDDELLVFDISGINAAVANAFRRILLSEVPTMAIEKVKVFQNTSIIADEVLAHRLGLLPIRADPRKFEYEYENGGVPSEKNTLVFTLDVECTRNPDAHENDPVESQFNNANIYSKDLIWVPQGKQAKKFKDTPVRMVHDDIVVVKMRPGQKVEIEMQCTKGIGKTHAKWSPVSTASYRLLPEISFTEEVKGKEAADLVNKCPMNVFDIEDMGSYSRAKVANARNCSMCRECIREGDAADKIKLQRVRDHFIFSIESTGIYTPVELFRECVQVLAEKCQHVLNQLQEDGEGADA